MNTRAWLFSSVVLGLGFSIACAPEEEERPGGINIGGGNQPVGSNNNGGEGGAATETSVSGDLVQFVDDTFAGTTVYSAPSIVYIAPATGGARPESGEFDGAEFIVDGDVRGRRWVLVRPVNDQSGFPTVSQQDLGDSAVSLPIVQREVLDQIVQSLTTPTELQATRGHLVVQVVDQSGAGVPAVQVNAFASGDPLIAYRSGATWQDLTDQTTADGLVFIPNLEASEFPGQVAQIVLTGAVEGEIDARVTSGAVTVVTFVVP